MRKKRRNRDSSRKFENVAICRGKRQMSRFVAEDTKFAILHHRDKYLPLLTSGKNGELCTFPAMAIIILSP
jgi:hypothetical protein